MRFVDIKDEEQLDMKTLHRARDRLIALLVLRLPRKTFARQARLLSSRQDGDAIPGFLAMPDRTITGGFDSFRGKLRIRRLQLLQNDNVRLRLVQPTKQDFETTVYAIDVVGGDFHLDLWSPLSPSPGLASLFA